MYCKKFTKSLQKVLQSIINFLPLWPKAIVKDNKHKYHGKDYQKSRNNKPVYGS